MNASDVPRPRVTRSHATVPGRISLGDWAEVELESGILTFLMYKEERESLPVGHRTHPMTTIPIGLAVDAAIVAASGKETGVDVLRACEAVFESPILEDESVVARGEVVELGRRHIKANATLKSLADGRLLTRVQVVLVRTVGGSEPHAQELEQYLNRG